MFFKYIFFVCLFCFCIFGCSAAYSETVLCFLRFLYKCIHLLLNCLTHWHLSVFILRSLLFFFLSSVVLSHISPLTPFHCLFHLLFSFHFSSYPLFLTSPQDLSPPTCQQCLLICHFEPSLHSPLYSVSLRSPFPALNKWVISATLYLSPLLDPE